MTTRRLLPAMTVAFLFSGLFTLWLSRRAARPVVQAAVAMKPVVVAGKNMNAGELLQPGSLKTMERPASDGSRGTFAKPEELAGRTLLIAVSSGDPILEHYLAPAGVGSGLTAKIPEGMRAISLKTDEVIGVAGFLLPGSLVDVLVTYAPSNAAPMVTATVLQDARILADGQKIEPDADGKAISADVITLLVTPQDAQKLTLASSLGKIHFILRNGSDRAETAGLTPQLSLPGQMARNAEAQRMHEARRAVKAPAPTRTYSVETMSGTKQATTTFEERAQ